MMLLEPSRHKPEPVEVARPLKITVLSESVVKVTSKVPVGAKEISPAAVTPVT